MNTITEAIVLVGGFGTRLREVVADVPKPMAPIAGEPFLALLLRFLQSQGIQRVILCVGYLHDMIIRHFGQSFGPLEVIYSVEDEPLGTGGAIARALKFATCSSVFVLNGDTFLKMDYDAMASAHHRAGSTLSVAIRHVPDVSRYDELTLDGDRIVALRDGQHAHPGLINLGAYLMVKEIFDAFELPTRFSFERDFLRRFISRVSPLAVCVQDYFIDIGVPADYRRAQVELPLLTGPRNFGDNNSG